MTYNFCEDAVRIRCYALNTAMVIATQWRPTYEESAIYLVAKEIENFLNKGEVPLRFAPKPVDAADNAEGDL